MTPAELKALAAELAAALPPVSPCPHCSGSDARRPVKPVKQRRAKYDGYKVVDWSTCHWQPGKLATEAVRQANLHEVLVNILREECGPKPASRKRKG